MAYETELSAGIFSTKYFSIDQESIIYGDTQMMCNEVTGFGYGATIIRGKYGSEVGRHYKFNFIDTAGDVVEFWFSGLKYLDLSPAEAYGNMAREIWQAFGNRILTETVHAISSGKTLTAGEVQFSKDGVLLRHRPIFGKDTEMLVSWYEIEYADTEDTLVLSCPYEQKYRASLPLYMNCNVQVIWQIMEMTRKDPSFIKVLTGK